MGLLRFTEVYFAIVPPHALLRRVPVTQDSKHI